MTGECLRYQVIDPNVKPINEASVLLPLLTIDQPGKGKVSIEAVGICGKNSPICNTDSKTYYIGIQGNGTFHVKENGKLVDLIMTPGTLISIPANTSYQDESNEGMTMLEVKEG